MELGTLTRLRTLTLRGNPLRSPFGRLADVRGDLAVVRELLDAGAAVVDLSECGFERLPAQVRGSGRHLELADCWVVGPGGCSPSYAVAPLRCIAPWPWQVLGPMPRGTLRELVLTNNRLTDLPQVRPLGSGCTAWAGRGQRGPC
jgi:hypothetical protein